MKHTIVVTGASNGIGKEIAILAGRKGYNVVINYLTDEHSALDTLSRIKSFRGTGMIFCADVSDYGQVDAMFAAAEKSYGKVDMLVNNAGIADIDMFQYVSIQKMRRIMDVNFWGSVNCARRATEGMVSLKKGRIVNISSIWGNTGAACEVIYSASKAALNGFTRSLAKELAPSGITVNAISPGVINTKMNAELTTDEKVKLLEQIPMGRMGSVQEVAQTTMFLLSDEASYITGQCLGVDGGF